MDRSCARTDAAPARDARRHTVARAWPAVLLLLVGGASAAAQDEPVPVRTAPIAELARPGRHTAPAEVLPPHRSVLAAETTATVREVLADVGARVAEGAVLVQLDDTDARLAVRQARAQADAAAAQVTLAEQRLARGRELGTRSFISQDELLALETGRAAAAAEREVAQAALAIAERALAKTTLRAPFPATITERHAQQGALAVPGTPLLTVVSTEQPELSAAVAAADADSLAGAARMRFDAAGEQYPVELLRLVDAIDQRARTREARLGFSGAAPLPGRTGSLAWEVPAASLPADLLVRRGGALGVFSVTDGRARFVPVPAAQEGRAFASPLPGDAVLVVEGQAALQDGDAVDHRP